MSSLDTHLGFLQQSFILNGLETEGSHKALYSHLTGGDEPFLKSDVLHFQRRLGDAAKKAIGKLQVRTIRKGDKVTFQDFFNLKKKKHAVKRKKLTTSKVTWCYKFVFINTLTLAEWKSLDSNLDTGLLFPITI